ADGRRVRSARTEDGGARPIVQSLAEPLNQTLASETGEGLSDGTERQAPEVFQSPAPCAAGVGLSPDAFGNAQATFRRCLSFCLHVWIIGSLGDCVKFFCKKT